MNWDKSAWIDLFARSLFEKDFQACFIDSICDGSEIELPQTPVIRKKFYQPNHHGLTDPSLRFKIQYISHLRILRVKILDATDLPAMDSDGKSDPFVETILMPQGCGSKPEINKLLIFGFKGHKQLWEFSPLAKMLIIA